MTALADFLLERLDEDEAPARAALDLIAEYPRLGPSRWSWVHFSGPRFGSSMFYDGAPSPDRVIADVDAKRRIVRTHADCGTGWGYCCDGGHSSGDGEGEESGCSVLGALALPFADHVDYRLGWGDLP